MNVYQYNDFVHPDKSPFIERTPVPCIFDTAMKKTFSCARK